MTGAVPELRFPEFKEEWERKVLGDFMTFKNGVNAGKDQYGSGAKFINVLDIITAGPIFYDRIIGRVEISERELEKNDVRYGDILFQRSSETREEVGQSNIYLDPEKVATFGGFVIRGRPVQELDPRFFDGLLRTDAVRQDMTNRSGGSTRFNIGQESLTRVAVTVPHDVAEQQKIADFLGAVDAKLDVLRRKKSGLEAFKSGLMQRLFSQELRFSHDDGSDFPEWEEQALDVVFVEVRTPVGNRKISTYSISAGRGFISQEERFGKDISGQQNERYIALAEGEFSYNKGNSISYKYGCIYENRTGDTIAVPNVFISFKLRDTQMSAGYFGKLFESHYLDRGLRTLISSGARMNGLLNVNKDAFFALSVPVPHPDEQHKIADALSAMDAKITAVSDQISHMETFKKGLLQQMFV